MRIFVERMLYLVGEGVVASEGMGEGVVANEGLMGEGVGGRIQWLSLGCCADIPAAAFKPAVSSVGFPDDLKRLYLDFVLLARWTPLSPHVCLAR